jgi:hypothetical protein
MGDDRRRAADSPYQAISSTCFFSGDHPGALGQVKVPALLRFPDDDSFMFNHINLGHNFMARL